MTLKEHQAEIDAVRYIKEGNISVAAPLPLPITHCKGQPRSQCFSLLCGCAKVSACGPLQCQMCPYFSFCGKELRF